MAGEVICDARGAHVHGGLGTNTNHAALGHDFRYWHGGSEAPTAPVEAGDLVWGRLNPGRRRSIRWCRCSDQFRTFVLIVRGELNPSDGVLRDLVGPEPIGRGYQNFVKLLYNGDLAAYVAAYQEHGPQAPEVIELRWLSMGLQPNWWAAFCAVSGYKTDAPANPDECTPDHPCFWCQSYVLLG
jgi:hypothetical protein